MTKLEEQKVKTGLKQLKKQVDLDKLIKDLHQYIERLLQKKNSPK